MSDKFMAADIDNILKERSKEVIFTLIGRVNAMIKAHRTDSQSFFGCGSAFEEKYWMALIRQVLVDGFLSKDIETYRLMLKEVRRGLSSR